jgi:DNA-binding FadR family transcriptional regulator
VTRPTPGTLVEHLSVPAKTLLLQEGGDEHFRDARLLFERGVARIAAIRATDQDIEQLRIALEANEAAYGDLRAFERTDVAFHYTLTCITENPIFIAVHEALVHWLTSQREVALKKPNAEQIALSGHRNICEAVMNRDGDAADRAMEKHLREITELVQS